MNRNIILADDDVDDREMFEDALMEIAEHNVKLTKANDGRHLMLLLDETVPPPPELIFLDLNMPIKNGFECLNEIKQTQKLKNIPVVIYSTSSDKDFIDKLYDQGADYYICKPSTFPLLKNVIDRALAINWQQHAGQPSRDKFILS
jgi:Response regulator containing CheY-like receiver, AAA-type ATPase, and DNA-binding domains